jgi:hypothetical protein
MLAGIFGFALAGALSAMSPSPLEANERAAPVDPWAACPAASYVSTGNRVVAVRAGYLDRRKSRALTTSDSRLVIGCSTAEADEALERQAELLRDVLGLSF